MNTSLYPGDYVIVNKLYYGSRLPKNISEVPWLNMFYYIFSKNSKYPIGKFEDNNRLAGYSKIKHNDILVFNYPHNQEENLIKRCIGLPNDTLNVQDTAIYINNKLIINPDDVQYSYIVCFKPNSDYVNIFKNLDIKFSEDWFYRKFYCKEVILSQRQKVNLQDIPFVLSIIRKQINTNLVKIDSFSKKNNTNEGTLKLIIPFKGMVINLDSNNFRLYKSLINEFENGTITSKEGKFFTDKNKEIKQYTFLRNYYYMMGDNRNFSSDSRVWGLLPEFCIVGKSGAILFSEYNWKRIFKNL